MPEKIKRRVPGFYITALLTTWITLSTAACLWFTVYYALMTGFAVGSTDALFELIFLMCTLLCRSLALYGILRCQLQPFVFFRESRFVITIPFIFSLLGSVLVGYVAEMLPLMLALVAPESIYAFSLLIFQTADSTAEIVTQSIAGAPGSRIGRMRKLRVAAVALESWVDRALLPFRMVVDSAAQSPTPPAPHKQDAPSEHLLLSEKAAGIVLPEGLHLPTPKDDLGKLWNATLKQQQALPAYQTA